MAALNIAGVFMSIYLYQLGYTIAIIGLFWAGFFGLKTILALPIARIIAWIGPKHAILISNILYIPAMVSFALLPVFGTWLLYVSLLFQAVSATMYSIGYLIDFSKVKSIEHAGKEIAFMNIFEKVTTGLSPLIGGFIAFLFGPQVVIVIAAILFAMAAAPLLRTGEPVRINQKLTFRLLEMRLDNVVFRLGIAKSRSQARQLVNHGHFEVNGVKTDIPSFIVKPGQEITVRARAKKSPYFKQAAEGLKKAELPAWLNLQASEMKAKVLHEPADTDLPTNFNVQMIIEYYSK
jgi:ribosomal 50S subunit-recycling heat shock protein